MSSYHPAMDVRVHHRESIRDPILDLILKKYNQASRDSIRGPVATKSDMKAFKNVRQANLRAESKDFKFKKEPDPHKLRETNLDGFNVGCFSLGGEKRLCFTELVQNVLKDYNVHEIFSRRDELLVYCSKCTPQQLDALKLAGILPWTSTSSNLITKSDAYRLWGSLYGPRAPKVDPKTRGRGTLSFEVYHECFGGCVGIFEPELYTEPTSQCIRCTECNGLFSPKKFVSHNHTSFDEVHTCHWGFESSRWRYYLLLVEQKPTRELLMLWDSIKDKFNGNRGKKTSNTEGAEKQDPDFVAFIKSPERKKATFSPIETLRLDRETRLSPSDTESSEGRPSSASEIKDTARHSAFHPWSPTHKVPQQRRDVETPSQSRFIFPGASKERDNISAKPKPSHTYPSRGSFHPSSNLAVVHAQCGCPAPLGSSPLYLSCQQCKTAAAASCSGLQLLAQKASERPGERDKPVIESGSQASCPAGCDLCQSQRTGNSDSLESTVENILRKYMSSEVKQPNISDVSHLLASELKKLHLSEEDKVRELTLQNQRMQAELHLMKMNYEKKFAESLETKRRVEQELEIVQREHQKDIARFNRITWEFQQEVNRHKASSEAGDTRETIEALRKESKLLQVQLEQSQIEQENLRKQVQNLLSSNIYHKAAGQRPSSNMDVDYPQAQSIVRHFPLHLKREAEEEPMETWRGKSPYTSGIPMQATPSSYQREVTRDSKVIISPQDSQSEAVKESVDVTETSDESDVEIES